MYKKPVPDFMKEYMANIGPECWADYDSLAQEMHNELQHYDERIHPGKAEAAALYKRSTGLTSGWNAKADKSEITERHKGKALEMACEKYGYKDPGMTGYSKGMSDIQEQSDTFSQRLNKNDFGMTPQDIRAEKAHAEFATRNNVTQSFKNEQRQYIEQEYGEERPDYSQPYKYEPQKNVEPEQEQQESKKKNIEPQEKEELVSEKPALEQPSFTRYEQQLSSFTYTMKGNESKGLAKDYFENQNDILQKDEIEEGKAEEQKNKQDTEITNDEQEQTKDDPVPESGSRYMSSLSSEKNIEEPDMPDMSKVSPPKNNIEPIEPGLE